MSDDPKEAGDWAVAEAIEHLYRLGHIELAADAINYLAMALRIAHARGISIRLQAALGFEMGDHDLPVDLRFIKGPESLQ